MPEPLRFKKFTMPPETEQLFSLKSIGDQNPSAKHSMSGGNVEGNSSSSDDMVSSEQQSVEENEAVHYLSMESWRLPSFNRDKK